MLATFKQRLSFFLLLCSKVRSYPVRSAVIPKVRAFTSGRKPAPKSRRISRIARQRRLRSYPTAKEDAPMLSIEVSRSS
jgi:hypothetical protein